MLKAMTEQGSRRDRTEAAEDGDRVDRWLVAIDPENADAGRVLGTERQEGQWQADQKEGSQTKGRSHKKRLGERQPDRPRVELAGRGSDGNSRDQGAQGWR